MTISDTSGKYTLDWEIGSAYDFFASLEVLHYPKKFGLRGAWAAGVRSRVSQEDRNVLEKISNIINIPFRWIHSLPEPRDIATVLYTLKTLPEEDRIVDILFSPEQGEFKKVYLKVARAGYWEEEDLDQLTELYHTLGHNVPRKKVEKQIDMWSKAGPLCKEILPSLQNYYDAFFVEEEKRILPKLEQAVETCRQRAGEIDFPQLLDELTRGLNLTEVLQRKNILLVPSFWVYPLVNYHFLSEDSVLLIYGARSPEESLDPGEVVPDELLLALKALADPTRLRILRYLGDESLTSAELARRLRLRAPTLTHHLHSLRLAGLVRISSKGKLERKYSVRTEAVNTAFASLKSFLAAKSTDDDLLADFEQSQIW